MKPYSVRTKWLTIVTPVSSHLFNYGMSAIAKYRLERYAFRRYKRDLYWMWVHAYYTKNERPS